MAFFGERKFMFFKDLKFLAIAFAFFVLQPLLAQTLDEEVNATYQWDDMSVFRINKEPARASFILCDSLETAKKPILISGVGKIYHSKPYRLLNSGWRFAFFDSPSEVKAEYFGKDFNDEKWDVVNLPDTWQTRGYDRISYANIFPEFIFDLQGKNLPEFADISSKNPSEAMLKPRIPDMHRQSAIYRSEFKIDDFSQNKAYFLRLCGVKSGVKVFVNGKFAGYSEDSFTPAEFDISKFLNMGKNSIALHVFKYTTGSYTEVQDMPHVMGVIRDVVLVERPKTHIADIVADAVIEGGKFKFSSKAFAKSAEKKLPENLSFDLVFTDSGGKVLRVVSSSLNSDFSSFGLDFEEGEVRAWSPDKPNLYQAVYILKQNGEVLETAKIDVGFRTFFIDEKLRLVWNGSVVKIKGVNRHNYAPEKGSAVPFEVLLKDILMIKAANINAIRTSHYPNPDEFYMLCNRLGIFVLDENNLESHALWNHVPGDSGTYDASSCDRMQNMVKRDRNHPCIFGWSLGNENGNHYTNAHKKMEAVAKKFAPAPALVHCEPATYSKENTSSFHSPMYGGLNAINSYLSSPRKKPFMFCEYCFAIGNSIGNLEDIWLKMRSEPALLGGFIWDWMDRTLWLPANKEDASGRFLADGRDFGTCRNAGTWCASGIVGAERKWTSELSEVRRVYQDIQMYSVSEDNLTLRISNEYLDTNLNELHGEIKVKRNGDVIASSPLKIDLPAGKTVEYKVVLPKFNSDLPGEYFYEISFKGGSSNLDLKSISDSSSTPESVADFAFGKFSKKSFFIKKTDSKKTFSPRGRVDVKNSNGKIELSSSSLKLVFDQKTAALETLSSKSGEKISTPFGLDISSAWIANYGRARREFDEYKLNGLAPSNQKIEVKKLSPSFARVLTSANYANDEGIGFVLEQAYSLSGDGVLEVSARIAKLNETPKNLYLPRVGIRAFMPKGEAHSVRYLGLGGHMNYIDRMQSADFGKWSYLVSNEIFPYAKPQDCGNRGGVKLFEVKNGRGNSLLFAVAGDGLNFSLLPNSQEEILRAKHFKDLPKTDVCELRIAPYVSGVGNGALGPTTLDKYRNYFEGSVEFKFLVLDVKSSMEESKGKFDSFYGMRFSDKFSYSFVHEEKNRRDNSLVKSIEGDWISKNAKIEYSSISGQYHPKGGNPLLCEGKNFAFHTERNDDVQYAVIDLGKICGVSGMLIYNRKDNEGNRTDNMHVYISQNGSDWEEVWQTKNARKMWKIVLDKTKKARFVKVELRKKEYFHLSGIKIFGK